MKHILLLFLFAFVHFASFCQDRFVNWYSQYQKIPLGITSLTVHFYPESVDSCYKYGLSFVKFQYLKEVDFFTEPVDSLFEAYVFNELSEVASLNTLFMHSRFKHDFSSFQQLSQLHIGGEGGIKNPSIGSLSALEYLAIGNFSAEGIQASDPIFQMKKVQFLSLGHFYDDANRDTPFPYEAVSQLEQLQSITVQGTISVIPDSWAQLQNLESVYLSTQHQLHLPDYFCKLPHLRSISLESSHCPEIPVCLLRKAGLGFSLTVSSRAQKDIQKVKRYQRKIRPADSKEKRLRVDPDVSIM